jgi:hypothetical protein
MNTEMVFETLPFAPAAEAEGDFEEEARRGGIAWRGRPYGATRPWAAGRPWFAGRPWSRPWYRRPWTAGGAYPVPYAGYGAGMPVAYPGAQQAVSERVRWVQEALNQVLGLQLRADGVVRPSLRSAIRAFQQRAGLRPSGRFGPRTRQALMAAVSGAEGGPANEAETLYEGDFESDFEGEDETRAFSGPGAECTAALKRAGKTQAEALAIVNAQVTQAVTLLRRAAAALAQGKRSKATSDLFLKVFRVRPDFVPKWLKPTPQTRDRGDVVAVRCLRVADMLASDAIRYFCAINATNCPDCAGASPASPACSGWGHEGAAPRNSHVVCLGTEFWDAMRAGDTNFVLATLMHEPFHIYFGRYVTGHRANAGKFGGVYCIQRFVFEVNGRTAPDFVNDRCAAVPARA